MISHQELEDDVAELIDAWMVARFQGDTVTPAAKQQFRDLLAKFVDARLREALTSNGENVPRGLTQ